LTKIKTYGNIDLYKEKGERYMQLFKGRYVALMCLFFILSFFIPSPYKIASIIVLGVTAFLTLFLFLILKRKREAIFILIFLCCASCLIGLVRSYTSIDLSQNKALEYEGNRTVEMIVISKGKQTEHLSEYTVNITKIGEDKTKIRAIALMPFQIELHSGDTVLSRTELLSPSEKIWGSSAYERTNDEKILLSAVIYDTQKLSILSCGNELSTLETLTQKSGIEIISNRMRNNIGNAFDNAFGMEISPLAKGFFMNDTSDISADVSRDFKRCGASHLMAVSGMHITILLGAIDRFLVNLFVDKKIRCGIISILSVGLLIITGFSSSASRAVIMLWITYLHFALADDEDSVTSLFFAIFVILLVFPYSCFDLGLWMSFLATLGIVTVYSFIDEKIPKKSPKKWYLRILKKLGIGIGAIILMTIVANLFVLPISWSVFGEVSLVAIPVNVILSPISTLFLCEIPVIFLLCKIPALNGLLLDLMRSTVDVIANILRYFSKWDHAVQSLNYVFADIIIPVLIVILIICLIIKLKYKWLMIIPPTAAIFAFAICLALTHFQQPPKAIYTSNGKEEMIVISENGRSVFCDISCSSADMYYEGYYLAGDCGATKIDTLILAHLSEEHPFIIERIGSFTFIDNVCLPTPKNKEEIVIVQDIIESAESIGAIVYTYNDQEIFESEEEITVYIDREKDGKTALISVFKGSTALNFTDLNATEDYMYVQNTLNLGRFAIISASSLPQEYENIVLNGNNLELLVFASENTYNAKIIEHKGVPTYVNKEKNKLWNIAFPLE